MSALRSRGLAVLAALALLALTPTSRADDLAPDAVCVRVGRLHTGREVLDDALIYVRGGKVEAILSGAEANPPVGVPLVDRRELVAIPGLVLTQLALPGQRGDREQDTVSARFRALDGFDAYRDYRELLAQGVTAAFVHPGRGRLVTGEGAVVKLAGEAAGRVLVERGSLCVELGDAALGPPARVEIPIPSSSDVPITPGEPQRPTSRLGLVPELRAAIEAALRYEEARERLAARERPGFDPDLAALAEAIVAGRLRIDARRASDLRRVVALAAELELRPVIAGATEVHAALAEVARLGSPVIFEVPVTLRGRPTTLGENPDRLRPRLDTPRALAAAGVPFALAPAPGSERELRLLAGFAARGGLAPEAALHAITRGAAEVLGVAERIGSLEPGRDADFVLLSGAPLATASEVVETWVDGRPRYRAPRREGAVVVRAGTIHTAAGPPIVNGEVLIQDGAIAAVGSSVPHPRGARLIDAGPHGVVTPGFVDAYGHLGLEGQGGVVRGNAELALGLGRAGPSFWRVARAGVTTVVLAPRRLDRQGSPLLALKTAPTRSLADDLRGGLVLDPLVGVAFDLRGSDPLAVPGGLRQRLAQAKGYAKQWDKYEADLAKWRAEREKKAAERAAEEAKARRTRRPGESEPAPEAKQEEAQQAEPAKGEGATVEQVPAEADPVSGTWTFTLAGGPFPPRKGELLLELKADKQTVRGIAREEGGGGEQVPVTGRLAGNRLTLTLDVQTPFGPPQVEADVEEDLLRGTVRLGPVTLSFEANRTAKAIPELKLQLKRSRSGKDGRPAPPPADPALEALRRVLAGEAVLAVWVDHPRLALEVTQALAKENVRAVLLGLSDADLVADALRAADVGVLLRPEATVWREGEELSPAVLLAGRAALGFMSEAEDGAAELPLRTVAAVARGLSEGQALLALTRDAARLVGLEARIGSLEVGKDGDLLVWSGPPFEATSRLEAVVIGGRVVPRHEEER